MAEVEHDGGSWIEVRTPKGAAGYVSTEQARSLLDYRIIFGRRDGHWRITASSRATDATAAIAA